MIKDINSRFTPKIENAHDKKKQPSRSDVLSQLEKRIRRRKANDLSDWSRALTIAEDPENPDREELVYIYKNMKVDGHVNGIITTLKNKIKAKDFMFIDSNDKENDKAKEFFESKWFPRYLDWSIEALFEGGSLIQLNDMIDGQFKDMELIKREFVIPELGIIKHDLGRFTGDAPHSVYNEAPLKDWFIFIGEPTDLGLFNTIAPQVISKKHLFSAMWQFVELFGMPFRVGKTDLDDPKQKQRMVSALDSSGKAGWIVTDKEGDEIELKESIRGDAEVFLEPIRMANQEISKNFTGVSGVFDDKAFVGSAEVQERMLKELIMAICRTIMFDINDMLIPRMKKQGSFPEDSKFKWKADDLLSTTEKGELIAKMLPFMSMTPDEIKKETGLEFEAPKVAPDSEAASTMSKVAAMYNLDKK